MAKVVKTDGTQLVFIEQRLEVLRNKVWLIRFSKVVDIDVITFSIAVPT